jgi:PAS domain-containing protein
VKAGPESQATRRLMNAYGWPFAAVSVALLIRGLLDPLLDTHLPFFTLCFATIFSAWMGGLRPGLLSLLFGLAGGLFLFAEPRYSIQLADSVQVFHLLRFAGVGIAISLICESLHRSRNRLHFRQQLLRSTLASIGDAVITTDAQGRITSLNEVGVALTGWTNEDAAGIPLDEVFRIGRPVVVINGRRMAEPSRIRRFSSNGNISAAVFTTQAAIVLRAPVIFVTHPLGRDNDQGGRRRRREHRWGNGEATSTADAR